MTDAIRQTVRQAIKIAILLLLVVAAQAHAINLKTAAQNSAPKYQTEENQRIGGLCVEIMNAIEAFDPDIQFSGNDRYMPFRRIQQYLKDGRLDVFFGFAKNEERLKDYEFIDTPLYQVNYVLAAKTTDSIDLSSLSELQEASFDDRIITVSGAATQRFLASNNVLNVDDSAESVNSMVKMLNAERGRFAFYHDLGLSNSVKSLELEQSIKILPYSFLTYYHYMAFSKTTPQATIDRVEKALKGIIANGTLGDIHSKYGLQNE